MLDLQDVTAVYLVENFQPELLQVIKESFTVLSGFSLTSYEDRLASLLSMSEDTDPNELRSQFIEIVKFELEELLSSHYIVIDDDAGATVKELNEIGLLLSLVQNLENTDQLSYRIHGLGTGKEIIVDLMSVYSTLPRHRVMELIESVDNLLIESMKQMVGDREQVQENDDSQRNCWLSFYKFIGSVDCLGGRLYKQGYFGLTFDELVSLSRFSVQSYLTETAASRPAQAALDTISLMLVCRDSYQYPVVAFNKKFQDMFSDSVSALPVKPIIDKIMGDYANWTEAHQVALHNGKGVVT